MAKSFHLPNKLNPNGRCALLNLDQKSCFFFKLGDDIYYRYSFDGTTWSSPVELACDVLGAFDVDTDGKNLYLVYIKKMKYDLCLLSQKKDQWSHETISSFSPNKGIPFYPRLVIQEGQPHVLSSQVCTFLPGSWHIRHYFPKGKGWSGVDVDGGEGLSYNYLAGAIADGSSIHLLYRFYDKGVYQLKYCSIQIPERVPKDLIVITKSPYTKHAPYFFKLGNNLFSVFLCLEGDKLKLNSIGEKNRNWGRERLLAEGEIGTVYPFVFQDEKNTSCFFQSGGHWAAVDFFFGEKRQADKDLIISLFEKNGGESFMSESFLTSEIKKELESELRVTRKKNEALQAMVSKLQEELKETKTQIEEINCHLLQSQKEKLSLKEEISELQQLDQQLREKHNMELEQLLQQLKEKDSALEEALASKLEQQEKEAVRVQPPEQSASSPKSFWSTLQGFFQPDK